MQQYDTINTSIAHNATSESTENLEMRFFVYMYIYWLISNNILGLQNGPLKAQFVA